MTESRKRPYIEGDSRSVTKKRALSSNTGSPIHVNGTLESQTEEPCDENDLEYFRKGAIFRRMRHYARQHERGQRRINELEKCKSIHDAELTAIDACWTQLVNSITLLVKREDLAEVDVAAEDVLDVSAHMTSKAPNVLVDALRKRMRATQQLVASFVKLAGQTHPLSQDDVYRRCQKAETESTSLRSELKIIRAKLHESEDQRCKLYDDLVSEESRADRLRSETLKVKEEESHKPREGVTEEEMEGEKHHQVSPPAQTQTTANGVNIHQHDSNDIELLESRNATIIELEHQNALLRDTVNYLKSQISQLPEETISNTPSYKILLEHASRVEHNALETTNVLASVREELLELQANRSAWESTVTTAATKEVEELKVVLRKRDDENARLRQQRDQQAAEIVERKVKNSNKSSEEFRTLAESRLERIAVLQSEVQRLRTRLAAINGDEDLLSFLTNDKQHTMNYVEDLKARLGKSETSLQALQVSLSKLEGHDPDIAGHIAAEADARQKLAIAQQKLAKYESTFGPHTSISAEAAKLVKLVEAKDEELRAMRFKEAQREQAESALYVELEKLSSSWEALDRQVKSKVFDLSSMEERAHAATNQKAKLENKFYSAMRDKEAVDSERKNIARNLEKQAKVIENMSKSEKGLQAIVATLEKDIAVTKKALAAYSHKVETLEKESAEWKMRAESENKRISQIRETTLNCEKQIADRNVEITKLKEEVLKAKREAEKAVARAKSFSTGASTTSSEKEAELQNELDKCMRLLKCSICQNAMRSTVITKCMHSFCKGCVDARISHRQRKCPACNLQFAQSDVQTLFLQ